MRHELKIRLIAPEELGAAFAVLRQLRPHLDEALFRARLARQAAHGYRLLGAFNPALVGVLGLRPVETMARGPHLHVDDLVVDEPWRGLGIGARLLADAEARARADGLVAVFLDSVPRALDFYRRAGYAPHTATLVRKPLAP